MSGKNGGGSKMKPMSDKKFAWWEKQRAQGKWQWILKTAALWGISMSVFMYLFGLFVHNDRAFNFFAIPIYLVGGIIVGWVAWSGNEGKYQHTLSSKDTGYSKNF
jgi:small neutral amino acid transporter SnatA (MarC family)